MTRQRAPGWGATAGLARRLLWPLAPALRACPCPCPLPTNTPVPAPACLPACSIQRPDGSWYGNWGVCFTYGTWFGCEALAAVGETHGSSASARAACAFLLQKQRSDGGWGESYLSCQDKVGGMRLVWSCWGCCHESWVVLGWQLAGGMPHPRSTHTHLLAYPASSGVLRRRYCRHTVSWKESSRTL